MDVENEIFVSVKLFTKVERYQIGTDTISLPARFSRIDLSKLVNETLELEKHIPFDFIINGSLLRTSLSEYMSTNGISTENTLSIEYLPIIGKPEEKSSEDLPDWVSGIANCERCYAVGCYDGSVHVYNADDTLLTKKMVHKRPIKGIDCQIVNALPMIASVSLDNTLRLQKVENDELVDVATCKAHKSHVMCCRLNASGLVASGAWNGSIYVWNAQTDAKEAEPVHSLLESEEGITGIDWWKNNVVSGGWDHVIRVWDLETEGMLQDMKGNKVVNFLRVNEVNQLVASAHPDGITRLWDQRQEKANVMSLVGKQEFCSAVDWHPKNNWLVSATDYAGNVTIFDIRSSYPLHVAEHVHSGKIFCGVWKSENLMLTGGDDKKLKRLAADSNN